MSRGPHAHGAPEGMLGRLEELPSSTDPVDEAMRALRSEHPEAALARLAPLAGEADNVGEATRALGREVAEPAPELLLSEMELLGSPRDAVGAALRSIRLAGSSAQRPRRAWLVPTLALSMSAAAAVVILGPWTERTKTPATPRLVQAPGAVPRPEAPAVEDTWAVEVSMGAAGLERGGEAVQLTAGRRLQEGDVLQTRPGGRVAFGTPARGRIHLDGGSRLRLARLEAGVPILELEQGRAEGAASDDSSGAALRFEHRAGSVSLVSGSIGVLRVSGDRLAVAAMASEAVVLIGGQRIVLPRYHQVRLDTRGNDLAPEALPGLRDVRLRQIRPAKETQAYVDIVGWTHPDVVLWINERPVEVERGGRFVARVSTSLRRQNVVALATDAAGRTLIRRRAIERVSSKWSWGAEPG